MNLLAVKSIIKHFVKHLQSLQSVVNYFKLIISSRYCLTRKLMPIDFIVVNFDYRFKSLA